MKKILSYIMILIVIVTLYGCNDPNYRTPEQQGQEKNEIIMEALKAKDKEKLKQGLAKAFQNQENIDEEINNLICQFTKQLGNIIPQMVPDIVSDIERKEMVNSLSRSDSEDPNKIYCNKVKRNPNGGQRSEFNADKTKLLRESLFKHFCNEPNVSFCYFAEPLMENDDATILKK